MRTCIVWFLALVASMILAGGTAAAARMSISNPTFRQIWSPLYFAEAPEAEGIGCNVTLEGSFHYRSFVKQARSKIGAITKAALGGCEFWFLNGVEVPPELRTTVTNTLPWDVSYESFEGTLPSIVGVRLLFRPLFVTRAFTPFRELLCLYGLNWMAVAKLSGNVITDIRPDSGASIPRLSGGIFCRSAIYFGLRFESVSRATVLGSETRITVSLI
jgi:hypothetical protein